MAKVWWAYLAERSIPQEGASALVTLGMRAGYLGFTRITLGYARTDFARNMITQKFLTEATDPQDALIMLDCDHLHPVETFEKLLSHEHAGVVGALAFMRGAPYNACAFVRAADGGLHPLAEWDGSLMPCDCIGHAALLVRRWVFEALEQQGTPFPYWRYTYTDGDASMPSEDMYFGRICERAGIPQFVDTSLIAPHLFTGFVDAETFYAYRADHPALQDNLTVERTIQLPSMVSRVDL